MKNRRKVLDKKGMTLVEVMVAFVILLIGMSALIQATSLSLKMMNKSREIQREADAAIADYYRNVSGTSAGTSEEVAVSLETEEESNLGEMNLMLSTYISPKTDKLEGGRRLYYFRAGGGTNGG